MTETASTNGGVSSHVFEQIAALEEEKAQLQTALESRVILEQAKGAISARCDVTPEIALEMMRGLARSQRRDLHEYAADIVASGGRLDA